MAAGSSTRRQHRRGAEGGARGRGTPVAERACPPGACSWGGGSEVRWPPSQGALFHLQPVKCLP